MTTTFRFKIHQGLCYVKELDENHTFQGVVVPWASKKRSAYSNHGFQAVVAHRFFDIMAPRGFEPPTPGFLDCHAIWLLGISWFPRLRVQYSDRAELRGLGKWRGRWFKNVRIESECLIGSSEEFIDWIFPCQIEVLTRSAHTASNKNVIEKIGRCIGNIPSYFFYEFSPYRVESYGIVVSRLYYLYKLFSYVAELQFLSGT